MKKSITNPSLKSLEVLVGKWEMEISNASFLPSKSDKVKDIASFEFIEDGGFLIQRQGEKPLPWAKWIIGRDDSEQNYSILYFDDRAVSRKYEMSFNDGIWKIWRQAPGFWQRYDGKISNDGTTITSYWEKSTDNGKHWKHDFDLIYKRTT